MPIVYQSPGVPGGEVSPGTGTTGFTSRGIAYVNSSGQLTANSSFKFTTVGGSPTGMLSFGAANSSGILLALFDNTTSTDAYGLGLGSARLEIQPGASGSLVLGLNATSHKVGFYGSTGTTRPAAYTASGTTATRTTPTSVTTATQTTADVLAIQNALNSLIGVVNNLIKDDQARGWRG